LSRSGFFANEACVSGGVVFAAATRNAASGHSACSISFLRFVLFERPQHLIGEVEM